MLISRNVQEQVKAATYGAALMQINIRDLRKISFAVPSTGVQKALLERLEIISTEIERLKSIYEQKAEEFSTLKQSILQKAFSGELTTQPYRALAEAIA